jgi:hypothetical protein
LFYIFFLCIFAIQIKKYMKKSKQIESRKTTAVEDIIEVIKKNDESDIKVELLILLEEKLKKETSQRFLAHRIGKIDVITDVLQKQSFFIKNMLKELKEIVEPAEFKKIKQNFLNIINSKF